MSKFQFVLLMHAHQPVGNFDEVFERAYADCYLPFLETLARHPAVRAGLHYSGPLLEWIERAHPKYFDRLRALVAQRQIELIGGGFYEPILVSIPPEDRQEQITRLAHYIENHFKVRPRGAWLAERVWEPHLPSALAQAGVEYTLVDDNHFLGAGFDTEQLYGYYLAEDLCHVVRVLPGLKHLRYTIPFHETSETIEFLHSAAEKHPRGFAVIGDDLEKFGVWPGTNEHVYRNGWLEKFFSELEQNAAWLETATPMDAIDSHAPLGRADLPTASYVEMAEWALPPAARSRFHGLLDEFSSRADVLPFLRGAIWRNFLGKYREANLLQKKMMHVSGKVRRLGRSRRRDKAFSHAREQAATHLLRGQCNDAYWHGVFGGLYSPHLRTAVWDSLAQAEAIADGLARRKRRYAEVTTLDFDADGRDEIYFTSDRYAALVEPEDGGTLSALDFRLPNITLINSLMRRPECYHAALRNAPSRNAEGVQSIHERTRTKEEGLERWLNYDRWPRHAFRLLLFGQDKNYPDCSAVRLDEDAALASGRYRVVDLSSAKVILASNDSPDWPAEKTLSFLPTPDGFDITCDIALRRSAPGAASVNVGIEVVLNFLAPSAPGRYFESDGKRYPLRWGSAVPGGILRVADEWRGVAVNLAAPGARNFWVAPIETVSESEDGFERIYQGSQMIAVWPVELAPGGEWKGQLAFRVSRL